MEQKLFSISELLSKSWDLYINNFQKFYYPILIMLAPYVLFYLIQYLGGPAAIMLMMILFALMIFINLWIAIVLIDLVNQIYHNQPTDFNKMLETSFRKIPSFLLVALLNFLVILGGFILLIIPGIIFIVWYGFASYINILEEKNNKGIAALKSSKTLVQGRWLATFIRLMVPSLLIYLLVMIIVAALVYMLTGGNINMESYEQNIMMNSISTIIFLILGPLFTALAVILYNNLKETKQETNKIENPQIPQ